MERFKLDESYFGGVRKGKRVGVLVIKAVFGLLKRNGKVYTIVVKDTKTDTLMPIIASKIKPDSVVYTDSYRSYNALDAMFKHFRINHSKEFAQHHNYINDTPNFWLQAKRMLRKYNGIDKKTFIFLSKTEFRFNYGTPSNQLRVLRRWCEI